MTFLFMEYVSKREQILTSNYINILVHCDKCYEGEIEALWDTQPNVVVCWWEEHPRIMEQLTGRLWGKKEHDEFTHSFFSLTLCKNSNEPIIVPWTGPQWCLGSTCFLCLTCPFLLPISHHFCLSKMSRYHFFFPKILSMKSSLVWNLFYCLLFPLGISILVFISKFNCLCIWTTWGQGIYFIHLDKFLLWRISVWPWLFLWQSDNQIVVPDQKPQWRQKGTSNWFTKRRVFGKSTMPNHKFMGFWTGIQEPGPFQGSLALLTHWSDLKSKALNHTTSFCHIG